MSNHTTFGRNRNVGQRWHTWRNVSQSPCPPFGHLSIVGTEVVGTEVIFLGDYTAFNDGNNHSQEYGVVWTAGFNSEEAVFPNETGRFTLDLPTWCLIEPNDNNLIENDVGNYAGLMSFVSYVPDGASWSLRTIPVNPPYSEEATIDSPFWNGYRVFMILDLLDFTTIWNLRLPSSQKLERFRIGLIGGLATYLRGGSAEPAP